MNDIRQEASDLAKELYKVFKKIKKFREENEDKGDIIRWECEGLCPWCDDNFGEDTCLSIKVKYE